ncbi:ABC transporter ATP-binding protein [Kitasatospora sp. NPDC001547]|uniref:ABC transporter ATP-binding protein n=1 Tax=Kitasatospora sp. NPDC001547 TaxID=3364015 RepID=UPI0036B904CA
MNGAGSGPARRPARGGPAKHPAGDGCVQASPVAGRLDGKQEAPTGKQDHLNAEPDRLDGKQEAPTGKHDRLSWRLVRSCLRLAAEAAPGALAGYAACSLAAAALPVVLAWLTRSLLDALTGHGGPAMPAVLGGGLVAAGVVTTLLPQLTRYLAAQVQRRTGLLAQEQLFTAVDGFTGLARFEDPRFLDRLRLAQQAGRTAVGQALEGLLGTARSVLVVVGFLGSLLVVGPALAAVVLLAGAPVLAAELTLGRRRVRLLWDIGPTERRELFYSELLTSVAAAKEVRLFGTGAFLRGRMLAERRTADTARRLLDRREVRVQSALGVLAALVSGCGLLWAVELARTGVITPGGVTMFVAAVAGVQGALAGLAATTAVAQQALLLFAHHLAVLDSGPDVRLPRTFRTLPPLREGIELRDVWFRYSPDHPWVLRGVDLFIPCGASVALVGLNGAGKSTLVKLLCRLYDPTCGVILWDGVDLREIDPAQLRARIGAVFQDFMHYDLTAAENIALGDLAALDDRPRIEAAAERAGVHRALAALPGGYDTLLSRTFLPPGARADRTTGLVLSGGQWQRLALARALLRERRDLMILDEPSAGLDAEAEYEVHQSLRQARSGRTSLLISHRLGAVREADRIVVLREGRVVESGGHDQLMAAAGAYQRLFALQSRGYRTAEAAS